MRNYRGRMCQHSRDSLELPFKFRAQAVGFINVCTQRSITNTTGYKKTDLYIPTSMPRKKIEN